MTQHTTEQRAFIIYGLANCFDPDRIVHDFNKRWKIDPPCTIGDVGACDPRRLTGDWLAYFNSERESFLMAPTADKKVRMALLNRTILRLEAYGGADATFLLRAMELMAKEDAGFFVPKAAPGAAKASGAITFRFDDGTAIPEPPC